MKFRCNSVRPEPVEGPSYFPGKKMGFDKLSPNEWEGFL
jgi:hypothetical protein